MASEIANCGEIEGELLIDLTRAELGDDEFDEVELLLLLLLLLLFDTEEVDDEELESNDNELVILLLLLVLFASVDCKSFKVGPNL